jgi:hypothetical protein
MMKKHEGKMHGKKGASKHGRSEMRALKRAGASRAVMAEEAAEYGMKDGGYVCGHRGKQDYGKR